MDKNYWVVSMVADEVNYAPQAVKEGFVALGWVGMDLTPLANLEKKDFTEKVYKTFEEAYPGRSKPSLMSGISQLYRFLTAIEPDDIIVLRDTENRVFHFGKVTSAYEYLVTGANGTPFTHVRKVRWFATVERPKFTQEFLNAAGGALTLFSISDRSEEIEEVLNTTGPDSQDADEFGMEAHLEDFIVENWNKLPEFSNYEIYAEDHVVTGKQYVIPHIGRIDILAKSKDGKEWLVIELKRGKTGDDVVGQTLRYIGWIKKNEAEEGESVRGLIIAGKVDEKLMYALETLSNVGFLTYQVDFKLKKVK